MPVRLFHLQVHSRLKAVLELPARPLPQCTAHLKVTLSRHLLVCPFLNPEGWFQDCGYQRGCRMILTLHLGAVIFLSIALAPVLLAVPVIPARRSVRLPQDTIRILPPLLQSPVRIRLRIVAIRPGKGGSTERTVGRMPGRLRRTSLINRRRRIRKDGLRRTRRERRDGVAAQGRRRESAAVDDHHRLILLISSHLR